MKPIMLQQIAQLTGLKCAEQGEILGVSVDSRLTKAGDLFFALPGAQADGHTYLAEASAKGAVAAVVKTNYQGPSFGMALLYSQDVLASLQLLAQNHLKHSSSKVVAISGSVGKTTTKDFICALLKTKFKVSSSPGNSNSQIGLPLAILNHASGDEDFLVLEMSMTHPGQIAKLVQIAPPAVAVITSVALVHACNFESIEAIAQTKAELFSHPQTKLCIYPKECDFGQAFSRAGDSRKLCYSTQMPTADYFLEVLPNTMTLKTHSGWLAQFPMLALPGDHNRHNFLAAAVAARHLGMSWEEIRSAQINLTLPERRLEIVERHGVTFVNDSYNASEVSVKSALSCLPKPKGSGKKIAVLGEMMELGKFSQQCHLAVGEHALKHVDSMLCFGESCKPIFECWQAAGRQVFWTSERKLLIEALRTALQPDDVVLLKGSRSKMMWKVMDEL